MPNTTTGSSTKSMSESRNSSIQADPSPKSMQGKTSNSKNNRISHRENLGSKKNKKSLKIDPMSLL